MTRLSVKLLLAVSMMYSCLVLSAPPGADEGAQGYVAAKDSIKQFFDALSARMKTPVIVSNLAAKKKISGNFDFSSPQLLLENITSNMGLVWYHDGNTLYVFDASELKNGVMKLKNSSVTELKNFLLTSGLYDDRYPLRSEPGGQNFYLSAPPIYFDLVMKTAANLDQLAAPVSSDINSPGSLMTIPLYNSFVEDRKYRYRDETITIPGIASVIRSLTDTPVAMASAEAASPDEPALIEDEAEADPEVEVPAGTVTPAVPASGRWAARANFPAVPAASQRNTTLVIANPGNNSLLVRGDAEQLDNIKRLVRVLDVPKRHIEMSVWIIDLQKDELEQLGVSWRGSLNLAGQFGVSLNGGISSTVDGASFMAGVLALSQQNRANIVSRPMLLTQENVPAIFDNSRTFYTRLVGERSASLEHVTYGTSLSVLPRFTNAEEIEMMLSVEDGNQYRPEDGNENSLPEVGRTNISTVARVPKGKSLLIGGYTRDENSDLRQKVPGLSSIPLIGRLFSYRQSRNANMVRVFLIQPKEIDGRNGADGNRLINDMRSKPFNDQLLDWMNNFLDAQR